jgi:hypothetical protein
MKFAPILIIPLLLIVGCNNYYADSPNRWKTRIPVEQVTPTPSPGNPYVAPEEVVSVPKQDQAL